MRERRSGKLGESESGQKCDTWEIQWDIMIGSGIDGKRRNMI